MFLINRFSTRQAANNDRIAFAAIERCDTSRTFRIGCGLYDCHRANGIALCERFRDEEIRMSEQKAARSEL
ncbi:hypothetical protein D3C80_500630 [compost metagenome]